MDATKKDFRLVDKVIQGRIFIILPITFDGACNINRFLHNGTYGDSGRKIGVYRLLMYSM